jgi:hybrid cluster-associated redox disulfide protein
MRKTDGKFPGSIANSFSGYYNTDNQNFRWRFNTMAVITKDTLIGDILTIDQTTAPYFFEMGMHCLGCPASRGETLEQACMVHGVDVNELLEKLNAHIAGK